MKIWSRHYPQFIWYLTAYVTDFSSKTSVLKSIQLFRYTTYVFQFCIKFNVPKITSLFVQAARRSICVAILLMLSSLVSSLLLPAKTVLETVYIGQISLQLDASFNKSLFVRIVGYSVAVDTLLTWQSSVLDSVYNKGTLLFVQFRTE